MSREGSDRHRENKHVVNLEEIVSIVLLLAEQPPDIAAICLGLYVAFRVLTILRQ
jgi:hypothetical protein